jgi:hypothetical protein
MHAVITTDYTINTSEIQTFAMHANKRPNRIPVRLGRFQTPFQVGKAIAGCC